jgi:ATP-binding cassette subfamily F protein 3
MVPAIRNILGGFLFSGDDIYKKAGVLSGGERTRLAVARMLLRPSNTLLLDEPTNHLDLDSKEVLLDALADYGGTLVFVSHDRYFVERLATRIVEVADRKATLYPGTYTEYLWSKEAGASGATGTSSAVRSTGAPVHSTSARVPRTGAPAAPAAPVHRTAPVAPSAASAPDYAAQKREAADRRKREKAYRDLHARIAELEARIAEREGTIKSIESLIAAPGFYERPEEARPILDQHQHLMWEVGDLLGQWEMLQGEAASFQES